MLATLAGNGDDVFTAQPVEAYFFGFGGLESAVEQGRTFGIFGVASAVEHLHADLAVGQSVHPKYFAFVGAHHVYALGQQEVVLVNGFGQILDAGL